LFKCFRFLSSPDDSSSSLSWTFGTGGFEGGRSLGSSFSSEELEREEDSEGEEAVHWALLLSREDVGSGVLSWLELEEDC